MHIDHIISNEISRDESRLRAIISDLSLPTNFDCQGLENLIASCGTCNIRKGGGPQEDGDLRYYLGRARRMMPNLVARIDAISAAIRPPTPERLAQLAAVEATEAIPEISPKEEP